MSMEARIDGGQVSEALQRVLRSQTFARSERLRSFLKFVVEMEQLGLSHQLKGYTIGIDVFSRSHGFDPGTDPLVRVQAGKLRKLAWADLRRQPAAPGVAYSFKYFEQVEGDVFLPAGFTPVRVEVRLQPRSGGSVTESFSWADATRDSVGNTAAP